MYNTILGVATKSAVILCLKYMLKILANQNHTMNIIIACMHNINGLFQEQMK